MPALLSACSAATMCSVPTPAPATANETPHCSFIQSPSTAKLLVIRLTTAGLDYSALATAALVRMSCHAASAIATCHPDRQSGGTYPPRWCISARPLSPARAPLPGVACQRAAAPLRGRRLPALEVIQEVVAAHLHQPHKLVEVNAAVAVLVSLPAHDSPASVY